MAAHGSLEPIEGPEVFLKALRDPGRNLKERYRGNPLALAERFGVKLPRKPALVMLDLGVITEEEAKERFGDIRPGLREMVEQVCSLETKSAVAVACRGGGKELPLETPVPTPAGWTPMGDLRKGDWVFNEQGLPVQVLIAHQPRMASKAYKFTFSDGTSQTSNAEHLWQTWTQLERASYMRHRSQEGLPEYELPDDWTSYRWATRDNYGRVVGDRGPEVRTTQQIVDTFTTGNREDRNHCIPLAAPLCLPEQRLPLDPWLLGYWLGNGSMNGSISAGSKDGDYDGDFVEASLRQAGWEEFHRRDVPENGCSIFGLRKPFREVLASADIRKNKIPKRYLRSSEQQRVALLRGLCDSDGYADGSKSRVEYCSTSKHLAHQVLELVRSLGERPVLAEGRAMLNGEDYGPEYMVSWRPRLHNPFSLPRKAQNVHPLGEQAQGFRHQHRMIASYEEVEPVMMRCITVDSPSSLYLAGEGMIPTHNSFGVSFIEFYLWMVLDFDALNLGGSELQADQVYRYILGYIEGDEFWQTLLKGEPQRERTYTKEDSWVRVLTASSKSVRSPHAGGLRKGKLRGGVLVIDEEAEAEKDIVESALPTINTARPSVNVRCSTFHNLEGSFQEVVDNHEEMGYALFSWDIFDVMERCECVNVCQAEEACFREDHNESYIDADTGELKKKLVHKAYCGGRGMFADGWIPLEEITTLWRRMRRNHSRWEVEAMGSRPSTSGFAVKDLTQFAANISTEAPEQLYLPGARVFIDVDWGTNEAGVCVWQSQPGREVLLHADAVKDNNQTQMNAIILGYASRYANELVEVAADIGGGGNYMNPSLRLEHRLNVRDVNFNEEKEAAIAAFNIKNEAGEVVIPQEHREFIHQVRNWKRKNGRVQKGNDHLCDAGIVCHFSQFVEKMGLSNVKTVPRSFKSSSNLRETAVTDPTRHQPSGPARRTPRLPAVRSFGRSRSSRR